MAKRRTCFVISPIGSDGSDVRQRANDFLELLVEPALQKFDFEVTRADRIQQPTAITGDIVRLVQESDLCVIDLTDTNPNVFYECGRRHETGKPFIQLISKDNMSTLPFDVAGIRTIPYDISSPRATLKSVQELQSYIQGFIDSGFTSGGSGESLTSIAQGIERLERKINIIMQGEATAKSSSQLSGGSVEYMMLSPHTAFRKAIEKGDVEHAFNAAQRYGPLRDRDEYVAMMRVLAAFGYEKAYDIIESMLQEVFKSSTSVSEELNQFVQLAVSGIRRYYDNIGDLDKAISSSNRIVDKISDLSGDTAPLMAYMFNAIGMLYWVKEENDKCIEYTTRATQLDPNVSSYFYNLALAYEHVGDEERLISALRKLKDFPDYLSDKDHANIIARHGA